MTSRSVAIAHTSDIFEKKNVPMHPEGGMEGSTKYMTRFMLGLEEPKAELVPNNFPKIGIPEHRDSFYNSSATRYNPHLVYTPTNPISDTQALFVVYGMTAK